MRPAGSDSHNSSDQQSPHDQLNRVKRAATECREPLNRFLETAVLIANLQIQGKPPHLIEAIWGFAGDGEGQFVNALAAVDSLEREARRCPETRKTDFWPFEDFRLERNAPTTGRTIQLVELLIQNVDSAKSAIRAKDDREGVKGNGSPHPTSPPKKVVSPQGDVDEKIGRLLRDNQAELSKLAEEVKSGNDIAVALYKRKYAAAAIAKEYNCHKQQVHRCKTWKKLHARFEPYLKKKAGASVGLDKAAVAKAVEIEQLAKEQTEDAAGELDRRRRY